MEIGRTTLNAGGLTAAAIRAWFSRFFEVFMVSAVFTVPIFILNGVLVAGLIEDITTDDLTEIDIEGTLLASMVSVLLSGILTAALVYVFIKIYKDEPFTVGGVLEFIGFKVGAIFVFTFVSGILIVIGFVALILPGIALIIAFSMGAPALLNEDLRGLQAIRVSFRVISGNWGLAIAVVALGLVINILLSLIVGGLAVPGAGVFAQPDFTDFNIGAAILQLAASAVIAPLIPALATGLYFEAKGRADGFPSV